MDADPRTDPYLAQPPRGRSPAGHHAWVLANAVADAPATGNRRPARRRSNLDVLFGPTARSRARTPSATSCRSASTCRSAPRSSTRIGALDADPARLRAGPHARASSTIAGHKVATIICFESAFGYQVRPLVHAGAQVIVVSTNNRSYERSANSAQHVAIGQMRAAETGRPVVQAAISGISAIIDANGVVHQRTAALRPHGARGDGRRRPRGETPYVRYGEWVIWACALALLGARVALGAVASAAEIAAP